MGKQVEPHSKIELSIGAYYLLSAEGPADFVEDIMTQLMDFVISNGMPAKVNDGEKLFDGVQKNISRLHG